MIERSTHLALQLTEPRPVRWLLALAWTVFIVIVLIQPEHQPVIHTGIPPGPESLEREIVFTLLHIIAFTLMTALWYRALTGHLPPVTSLIIAAGIALVLGGLTEWAQAFAPDRHPSVSDFLSNVIGMLLVVITIRRLSLR